MLTEHVQLHIQPVGSFLFLFSSFQGSPPPKREAPRKEVYACHQCGSTFDTEIRLVEHVASHVGPQPLAYL